MTRFLVRFLLIVAAMISPASSAIARNAADRGAYVELECAPALDALASIRARLAAMYGSDLAGKACAAFLDTGVAALYSRLVVVTVPFEPTQTHLQLYGLRPDGGWTDVTPHTFLFDPSIDRLTVGPGTQGMPSVHVERGRSRVVFIFDPGRGLYWVIAAEGMRHGRSSEPAQR